MLVDALANHLRKRKMIFPNSERWNKEIFLIKKRVSLKHTNSNLLTNYCLQLQLA